MASGAGCRDRETLAELASELELPDAALAQTVETYNQAAASGHDEKFHKSKDWLKPLTGPFVALDCTPGNGAFFPHFTLGGLDTTVDGQVLTSQGEVIPGSMQQGERPAVSRVAVTVMHPVALLAMRRSQDDVLAVKRLRRKSARRVEI